MIFLLYKKYNCNIINGLPQYDNLLLNKDYIINNKNNIYEKYNINKTAISFLIIGTSVFKKEFITKVNNEIKNICNIIKNLDIYYHIFIKHKMVYYEDQLKSILSPNITLIDSYLTLYNYLFCDIIIIQGETTSIIESLLINNNTIVINNDSNTTIVNNMKKYNKLYHTSYNNLELLLKYIINNKFNVSDEYLEQKKDFLNYYNNNINVCDKIFKNIINKLIY